MSSSQLTLIFFRGVGILQFFMVKSSILREDGRSSETCVAHLAVRLGNSPARSGDNFFRLKKG